ncbi:SCHIZORIZA, heat shock transcription factor B4 [Hibiscus trionum]|uniref:SCHIZORIZA, heat shock transcription factor B4 n=1 Tax=Hibiscus trionum TaxID=183268 RepID=A0A9W7IVQ5_HIBTR|nr:SCHIZORIZA, heat shock transcription factor B4 [Hibiscus trionum]
MSSPLNAPSFFPYERANWCDSPPPPLSSTRGATGGYNKSSVTALSEDNERLRRNNSLLMSELTHMKKLYNEIVYFVQNQATPSNSYSPLLLSGPPLLRKPSNQFVGYYPNSPNPQVQALNSPTATSQSSLTIITKLFGVALQSKKRLHPEYNKTATTNMETSKAVLVLEKDDLRLNLLPSSTC